MSKFFKTIFSSKDEIPPDLAVKMKFGFVIKYADNIVTGWCSNFANAETSYTNRGMLNPSDTTGIKITDVVLDLGETLSYHSFITIIGVPIMFFPNEEFIEKKKEKDAQPYLEKKTT